MSPSVDVFKPKTDAPKPVEAARMGMDVTAHPCPCPREFVEHYLRTNGYIRKFA